MKTYEIIEKIRNNINEALDEAYQRGKQDGFESNTAYRHGYYDGQKDAYKERKATEQHWGKPTETRKHNPVIDCGSYPCNECETLSKYESKQTDEIRVGDEVMYHEDRGIIVNVANGDNTYSVLCCDYSCLIRASRENLVKTGRHFPQISDVLRIMRETT